MTRIINEATGVERITDIKGVSILSAGRKRADKTANTTPAIIPVTVPNTILNSEYRETDQKFQLFNKLASLITVSSGEGINSLFLIKTAANVQTRIQKIIETIAHR